MSSAENSSTPLVVEVTFDMGKFGSLPEQGLVCLYCDTRTEKTLLEHSCGDKVVVSTKGIPGYECPDCGHSYYLQQAINEVLAKAVEYLEQNGDSTAAQSILKLLAAS